MAVNPLLYKQNFFYFLLALVLLIGLQVAGLHFWLGHPVLQSAIDALISWLLLAAVAFAVVNSFSFYHPAQGKFFIMVSLPAVLAFLILKASGFLFGLLIKDEPYLRLLENSQFYRATVFYLLLVGSTGFSLLFYRLQEKEAQQRRKEETDRMLREAELFKLRQQLQPHFLFNSLNSINSLVGARPQEARSMVQQLSEFLRGTLRREDQRFISLREELDYLKLYLEIEKVRFGHRLTVDIDFDEEALEAQIPPLLLQPLLENAIKFGLYGTVGEIVIHMSCKPTPTHLQVKVSNPYDEDESSTEMGTGFGLKSVKRRLYLLFGRTDLLNTRAADGNFTVLLKIPLVDDKSTDH